MDTAEIQKIVDTEGDVAADYLEERGLKEGSHGEILNERGRTVFEVGFASAIRKVLGD